MYGAIDDAMSVSCNNMFISKPSVNFLVQIVARCGS